MLQNVLFFPPTNMVTTGDVAMWSGTGMFIYPRCLWPFTVHVEQQVKEVYILNIRPH